MAALSKILRPEVVFWSYARDNDGVYWRVEELHDGTLTRQRLPRAPVGATCHASADNWRTFHAFTVGPDQGATVSFTQVLCLLGAVASIPAAIIALPGSTFAVALLVGVVATVLFVAQFFVEQLAATDPKALRRLIGLVAADMTFHALIRHHYRSVRSD